MFFNNSTNIDFVLAIMAAVSGFIYLFNEAYPFRQDFGKDTYFCKCCAEEDNQNNWHATLVQVEKEFQRDNVPYVDSFSDKSDTIDFYDFRTY